MTKFAILLNGLPGAGKSTVAERLVNNLDSSLLVSSNQLRNSLRFKNLLSDSQRDNMLEEILASAQSLWSAPKNYLIFDTNLFDRKWRGRFIDVARKEGRKLIFIHCRASMQDIFCRTEKKFGAQVNYDSELLSVSDMVGFVERRAVPLSYAEVLLLEAYGELNTSGSSFANVYMVRTREAGGDDSTTNKIFRAVTEDVRFVDLDEYSSAKAFGKETVLGFEQSYQGMLRSRFGSSPVIVPSVRAVSFNSNGDSILLIRRRDDSRWALPSGGIELGESVETALAREFMEETGLPISSSVLIAIHSGPKHAFTNSFGDQIERVTFCFNVSPQPMTPRKTTSETTDLRYFPVSDLPEISSAHRDTIQHCMDFSGTVILG